MAIGAGALAAVAILVALASRGGSLGTRDLEPSGRIEQLFNGQNINEWIPVSGGWSQGKDDEGALVLEGSGLVRRAILGHDAGGRPQPLAHYRLMLAVDPHEASAIEVQFDLAATGRDDALLFVRIDGEGSTLGSRGDGGDSSATTIAHRASSTGPSARHAIEIERQTAGWWAFIDGQLLGSAPFLHADPVAEFRLSAAGGRAWFSDLTFEELEPRSEHPSGPTLAPREPARTLLFKTSAAGAPGPGR